MSEPALNRGRAIGARLSVMMFLEFFVWGAWYVTMGTYLVAQNMEPGYIGRAYALGPIAAIVSPFFLGMVADRFFATERVLAVMQLLGAGFLLAAPFAMEKSPGLFLAAILLHMLCFMPTLGLTNTLAFHNMTNQEKQFPLIRVWGTIGWIAAAWVVSKTDLATADGVYQFENTAGMFYVAGAAAVLMGLYSLSLPHTPPPGRGTRFSAREALGLDAIALMKERSFAVFIVCSFLICIPLAAYYAFANQFVGEMGFTDPASTMSFGQMSEILFMVAMPLFFVRLGVKWMLLVGMGAWVLRYGLFAGAADDQVRWMVLAGILLHGVCYDFFFVTGQIYVDKKAAKNIRGAAQGFLVLVTQGLGMFIGAMVAGVLVARNTVEGHAEIAARAAAIREQALAATGTTRDTLLREAGELYMQATDWRMVWLVPAVFAGVVMLIFFALFRAKSAVNTPVSDLELTEAAEDVRGTP